MAGEEEREPFASLQGRHHEKIPGASNYLEELTSVVTQKSVGPGTCGEVRGECLCDSKRLRWVESYVAQTNCERTA